jgi:hypothetical protein
MPQILARGLMVLRETCIMPRLVNSSYSKEAAEKGDTINIPIPSAISTINVTPSNTLIAPTDVVTAKVDLSLDQWKQNTPFHLTDKELNEIARNEHFMPHAVGESVRGLANDVNLSILNQYKGIYGFVGLGTGSNEVTPFASTVVDATSARKVLNQQLAPKDFRRAVLDWDAEANALALSPFADAEKTMSDVVKIQGELGRKYGIDWFADDQIVTHTAGTATGDSTTGSAALGATTVNRATTSGTMLEGDIITFANHSQTYSVAADVASGGAAITFTPPLKAAVPTAQAISIAADHVVNLAFHRDAFAYATRPLVSNTLDVSLGSEILSMQDPKTGLVMRLEASRQHKQVVWEFDILWGAKLVRPELAVRIAG